MKCEIKQKLRPCSVAVLKKENTHNTERVFVTVITRHQKHGQRNFVKFFLFFTYLNLIYFGVGKNNNNTAYINIRRDGGRRWPGFKFLFGWSKMTHDCSFLFSVVPKFSIRLRSRLGKESLKA